MIRALAISAWFQTVIFVRLRQAMFFTIVFPAFLFVVFGFIFGTPGDTEYYLFLMTGVAGATALSDGLFAVGPVVREFYNNGFIGYVRQMPHPSAHVGGLFLSRYIVLFVVVLLLMLISLLFFGATPTPEATLRLLLAIAVGFTAFSIIGLAISFIGDRMDNGKGFGNVLYFVVIFTSPAFYPIDLINPTVARFGDFLPLTPILHFARNEAVNWWPLIVWGAVSLPVYLYSLKTRQIKR
ncbi:ABC transporter permease [Neolewinella aurantiaca]|uniref:ABC transporter permease n=1 Tax=Neolewinella aurantiaca TaxID=2602767 RepID=A0A5C7FLA0_9BACT|nr:ABC transporter permease [Neolewinella aurantiaca]TXF87114.1 ABC transporter permease [Neolewinella aurantiaca]